MAAAARFTTVLLRSDGKAAACGDNGYGMCDIPALEGGVTYVRVAAEVSRTVFCEAMVKLWLLGTIAMELVTSQRWRRM